ncbi:MAG: TauD/TfdA dioxygenase family protein [Burkholderiales bacterium]
MFFDTKSSAFEIESLTAGFGARIHGLDLSQALSPEVVASIQQAIDHFAVLVFAQQMLDDGAQIRFARYFGEMEASRATVAVEKHRLAHPQINDISNLIEAGTILAVDDRRRMFNLGNRLWHSDSSFKVKPAKYSFLHAREIPSQGGETEFCDTRLAYEALGTKEGKALTPLICEHSLLFSRAQLGFSGFTEEEQLRFAPVRQRLVRRHQPTGRVCLFLSSHIGGIEGMPRPEALMLIRDLIEAATRPDRVYQHRWSCFDLVMWDNRATMHRGRAYNDQFERRDMRRVTIAGEVSSLDEAIC